MTTQNQPMQDTPEHYQVAAKQLRLLSHPARLQILDELRRGEACVCHLQLVLGRPQAYVSQQLRVLRDAALLKSNRDGLNIFYKIADDGLLRLLDELLGAAGPMRRIRICPCPSCTDEENCEPTDSGAV